MPVEYPDEHATADDDGFTWSIPSASTPIGGPPYRLILTADAMGLIELDDAPVTSQAATFQRLRGGKAAHATMTVDEARWLRERLGDAIAAMEQMAKAAAEQGGEG